MLLAMSFRGRSAIAEILLASRLGFAWILVLAVLVGCSSTPTRILDSDIPQVPGMEQRLGFDIKRQGGDIVGGVFVFVGPLLETETTMRTLTSRFKDAGWVLERATQGFPRSALVFEKNGRRVEVALDADQLEPAMSRAQYVVSLDEPHKSGSNATDASGTTTVTHIDPSG